MITLTKRLRQEAETSSGKDANSNNNAKSASTKTNNGTSGGGGKTGTSVSGRVSIRDKLLVKEVQEMETHLPNNCKIRFDDPNVLHDFLLTIVPDDGYWQGGKFRFHIHVTEDYNIAPPVVKCHTKLWHPNINEEGNVCLSILRQNSIDGMGWAPTRRLKDVIWGLNSLFSDLLNFDDPLNIEAADHFMNDKESFRVKVRDWVHKYAKR